MPDLERRDAPTYVGLEQREDGAPPSIVGVAAVYFDGTPQTEFRLMPGVVERIEPGAFDKLIREEPDVVGLFNHDPNHVLGRSSAGTLSLSNRPDGLHYTIRAGDGPTHENVAGFIRRREVTGSSFGFRIAEGGESWERTEAEDIRWIHEISELRDVGPVTFPAYPGTEAAVGRRSVWESYHAWLDELAAHQFDQRQRHAEQLCRHRLAIARLHCG